MKRAPVRRRIDVDPSPRASDEEIARRTIRIPHDPINEDVLLAAAIVSPDTRKKLIDALPADGFFGRGNRPAWEALIQIDRKGLQYDPATVRQLSGGAVDTEALDALVRSRPELPPNLDYHVACFLWDRVRCQAAEGPVSSFLEALRDPTAEPDRVRALAAEVGRSFDGAAPLPYLRDSSMVRSEAMRRIRARRTGEAIYPFGIDGLDFYEDGTRRMKLGLAPGHMTLIVGLSGSGKTTFANQIVLAQARAGRRVLHGGWEEDGESNMEMLAAFSAGVSRSRLMDGKISDKEEAAIDGEMAELEENVRFFELPFGKTSTKQKRLYNSDQLDVIERHVAGSGCDVLVFDLFKASLVELEPQAEELALRRMLAICKATRTHAILLHHLRGKDVEQRPDKRPTRESIKGASAWVEASDTILGIHWPWLWSSKHDERALECFVLKQRKGRWPLGIEFGYEPDTGLISGGRSIEYEQPGERDASSSGGMDGFLYQQKRGR